MTSPGGLGENEQSPLEGNFLGEKGEGSRFSPLRVCEVGRVAFCLAVSLPSESGAAGSPGP